MASLAESVYFPSGTKRIDCHVAFSNNGLRRDISAIVRLPAGAT